MRAKRTDDNQAEIVSALRQCGCTVQILSNVGEGCPDLLIGVFGMNYLLEVKNPEQAPSAQSLTGPEAIWHNQWKGQVAIVRNVDEALAALKRKTYENHT